MVDDDGEDDRTILFKSIHFTEMNVVKHTHTNGHHFTGNCSADYYYFNSYII